MVTVQTVIFYQNLRLATLKRDLGGVYQQTAEVLEPTQPSFFEKNKKVFRALAIFLIIIGASYATKMLVWVAELIATWLKAAWPESAFSIKRVTTLVSFAASISRLFIWIFGIITILYEFGIDPATSTGAIGLVGLIMAGMFQQIVVDFIKGLDIVAGRHYNVGDFIEVDGKYGHVIDFNVKYTRIRTFSGQELNIPNSRCIPSRRFPEGFVDNYVDIVLCDGADVSEAKDAINRVSMYVTRQLEAIKERPGLVDRFRTVGGRPVLRYHLRILPGCEWVVTDYFIPAVKAALLAEEIGLEGEPKYFFINRIDTFRKLFSRQLSEQEILQEAAESDFTAPSRKSKSDGEARTEKAPPPGKAEETTPSTKPGSDGPE
jgi:small-conductance mechanosensitive channel